MGRMGWMGRNGGSVGAAVALLLFFVPALPALPAHPAQEQPPSFRSTSSELVVLPVIVTDRPDRYVSGLTRDHFVVYDNGRKVPVEFFTNEDTPVTVGLVVDSSSSMRTKVGDVMAAAMAFAKSSNPDDELFAISFNDDVRDTVPGERFVLASDLAGLTRALVQLRPEGRTSLYDGVLEGLERLHAGTRPRKALVVISDGGDNASTATLSDVVKRARSSNAPIYTVGVFDEFDLDRNPGVLKQIAEASGGERFLPRSAGPLLQACEHIAREIRSGYTLGYVPPDRDGAFHRIRVEVAPDAKRKFSVRTRPGYFAARASSQ